MSTKVQTTHRTVTRVDLGARDACVVFRRNGWIELRVPSQADDEIVHEASLNALRCITLLMDERAHELLAAIDRLNGSH